MKPAARFARFTFHQTLLLVIVVLLLTAQAARAQQTPPQAQPQPQADSAPLPDSPQPKPSGALGATSEFVGYLTNRSLVFPNIATSPGPISTGQKFKLFVNEAVSPPIFLVAAVSAAYGQARNSPEADGQGASGYFTRFGTSVARGASNSFFGTFVLASALHQDPRYFPHSHESLWHSIGYAAKRVVVTRKDNGDSTFNSSGLIGIVAGETLANVYLPRSEQTVGKTAERFSTDMGWYFAGNVLKEYWPTLFKDLGLKNLKVVPDPNNSSH